MLTFTSVYVTNFGFVYIQQLPRLLKSVYSLFILIFSVISTHWSKMSSDWFMVTECKYYDVHNDPFPLNYITMKYTCSILCLPWVIISINIIGVDCRNWFLILQYLYNLRSQYKVVYKNAESFYLIGEKAGATIFVIISTPIWRCREYYTWSHHLKCCFYHYSNMTTAVKDGIELRGPLIIRTILKLCLSLCWRFFVSQLCWTNQALLMGKGVG
jgi:hypothetical protein